MLNLNSLANKISNDINNDNRYFRHKNLFVLGKNSCGKSFLLKEISTAGRDQIFFIGSQNRGIGVKRTLHENLSMLSMEKINTHRLKETFNTKKDEFLSGMGDEIIIGELIDNFVIFKPLLSEVLNLELNIINSSVCIENDTEHSDFADGKEMKESHLSRLLFNDDVVTVDGVNINNVSEGYKSLIRILVECEYACNNNCKAIVIDEFDSSLDYENVGYFINSIISKYPNIRFVLSGHSPYSIINLVDFDIIKIVNKYDSSKDNLYITFDSNDFNCIEMIDRKLFDVSSASNRVDLELSNLLSKILNGQRVSSKELAVFEGEKMSVKQAFTLDFIKEKLALYD